MNKRWINFSGLLLVCLTLTASVAAQNHLGSGKKLKAGQELKNRKGILFMRHVGNLTMYDTDHNVEWETGTYIEWGQQIQYAHMSEAGDLEVIVKDDDTGKLIALWSSKTSEKYGAKAAGAHLEIDWNKYLLRIVSKHGKELWRSQ